jgi:NADPH2:quinone reductase
MRALLCRAFGPPSSLKVEEVEPTECGAHAVVVDVHAAGVNFPDTLIIAGKYQFQPPFPFAPGGELAGEIVEVGAKVEGLQVGDRVMGLTGWGAFAERVVVPAAKCLKLPAGMDFVTGAGFGMTYGTSYHALVQRGRLQAGETLVVHGASGGVGTAAVEIGKVLGAKVIATSGSADKLAQLREAYAVDEVLDLSAHADLKGALKKLTKGNGADVIYDPVGGPLFEPSLRSLAWDGRLLVVGFASGEIPSAKANLMLLKGASVVGVFWGAFATRQPADNAANFRQLFDWYEAGKLEPLVTQRFALDDAGAAIQALVDRKVVGKAVVTMR